MAISKELRRKVWGKYSGHCSYCGREIKYEDMQVDHLIPQCLFDSPKLLVVEMNSIENLMPSCRMCNHYKRANSIETFRRYIAEIPKKLSRDYIYKIGVVYGNVIENEKPIKFYFETVEAENEHL